MWQPCRVTVSGAARRDFLVSYAAESAADRRWAEWIAWTLEESGHAADGFGQPDEAGASRPFSVYLDAWDEVAGDNTAGWLDSGLRLADRVVVVLSRAFLAQLANRAPGQAAWQAKWVEPAGAARRILPVRIDRCQPDGLLATIRPIDLAEHTESEAKTTLLTQVGAALVGRAKPAARPSWPGRPEGTRAAALPEASERVTRGAPSPRDELLDRVEMITRLRHPRARITAVPERASAPAHLWFEDHDDDGFPRHRAICVCVGPLSPQLMDRFADTLRDRYRDGGDRLEVVLVFFGDQQATDELRRHAATRYIALRSWLEYQGILDFRSYVERQTDRLAKDRVYPPELYVPQRLTRLDVPGRAPVDDALGEVVSWLSTDGPRFVLLLGDAGRGKTFLLHELARVMPEKLPHLTPMLIDLRDLDKSHDLDKLVAAHLAGADERRFDLAAFHYLLREGRIALLFDGYDELAIRVGYSRATDHLNTLFAAAVGSSKVVVTSRTQHFLRDDDVRNALGQSVEMISGSRLARVEKFTREQVRQFLVRRYRAELLAGSVPDRQRAELLVASAPDHERAATRGTRPGPAGNDSCRDVEALAEERADQRIALMASIDDLSGLAANPRLLSFIADLSGQQLAQARSKGRTVDPAVVYDTIVRDWLDHETRRANRRGAEMSLDDEERLDAATQIALALWRSSERSIGIEQLEETAAAFLATLTETHGLDNAMTAQLIGSDTLLSRDENGRFSFIHSSIMEYLVAVELVDTLHRDGLDRPGSIEKHPTWPFRRRGRVRQTTELLAAAAISDLTADFLLDLAGSERIDALCYLLTNSRGVPAQAKANALTLIHRVNARRQRSVDLVGADLAGQDLSGQNFAKQNLSWADLSGANLTDVRLDGADLTEANLTGATLTRTVFDGAQLPRAVLRSATARYSQWGQANLTGADLTGADLEAAMFAEVDLTTATLTDSRWGQAVVLGGGFPGGFAPTDTAWPGDARPYVQTGHLGTSFAVAFVPTGNHLATVFGDGTVRMWKTTTGQSLTGLTRRVPGVSDMALSPDGSVLATVSTVGTVRLWNPETGAGRFTIKGDGNWGYALAFSPDGSTLAIAGANGLVKLWNPATGHRDAVLVGHTRPVRAVVFSPDGNTITTASDDGTIRLWETASLATRLTLRGPTAVAVAFSPDGRTLASATDSPDVDLWDPVTGERRQILRGHPEWVRAVAFSPGGDTLAAACSDGVVVLWDTRTWQRSGILARHANSVGAIAFSPDGATLATGSSDGTTRLWDIRTRTEIVTMIPLPGDGWAALLPDGRYKISGQPYNLFWWRLGDHRFGPGALDRFFPTIRRIDDDEPLPRPTA
jgi:Tol biopolymer transport system component